jgi:hypothetical protein
VGAEAFLGCTALAEVDLNSAEIAPCAFSACYRLTRIHAHEIRGSDTTLLGSSVTEITGGADPDGRLLQAVRGPGGASVCFTERYPPWQSSPEARLSIRMADFSKVKSFPPAYNMQGAYFLEEAILSRRLESIPDMMFAGCQRLRRVNTGLCPRLDVMGFEAFAGCWDLHDLDLPEAAARISLTESGLRALRLGQTRAAAIDARRCPFLARLEIRNRKFRGTVDPTGCRALESLTLPSCRRLFRPWPSRAETFAALILAQVRYTGSHWDRDCSIIADIIHSRSLAEIASVCGRESTPSPPM